jgi:hypothetical protein
MMYGHKTMAVFWVVAPCSLVEVYKCFRGPCYLHHHHPDPIRLHGDITQKTAIFVPSSVRTSNPTCMVVDFRKVHNFEEVILCMSNAKRQRGDCMKQKNLNQDSIP